MTFAVIISAKKKTKTDDGKTLTLAAWTQSSMVVAEDDWFRKGCETWCGPPRKEYEFEQAYRLEFRCRPSGRAIDRGSTGNEASRAQT